MEEARILVDPEEWVGGESWDGKQGDIFRRLA